MNRDDFKLNRNYSRYRAARHLIGNQNRHQAYIAVIRELQISWSTTERPIELPERSLVESQNFELRE
ncbi:hypothetical protein DFR27_0667 [Umboniibacter marinipuniceus]|uniref:Uncharacterized protein n=1 Tax=Umboniibacter marinipuniceus TaxID=569599 RepID=A0A3M0ACN3_9GAMM|nr:hypothetical protein DFR27_0667 [Umboniibacter marinipuniceus]